MRMPSKNAPSISPRLAALVMILAFNVGVVGAAKATTSDPCGSQCAHAIPLYVQLDPADTPSMPGFGADLRLRGQGAELM